MAFGPSNIGAGERVGVPRPSAPDVPRPVPPQVWVPPPSAPAPGVQPPGGFQATNGTDTAEVTDEAVRAFNAGVPGAPEAAVPPNPTTQSVALAEGVPPEEAPLTPEELEEEETNVRAEEEPPPPPPEQPHAPIPEILEEFAPGETPGQNMDMTA